MQAAVVHGIGDWAIETVPRPAPGPGEVLIKVEVAGLCRTDVKLIEHGHRDLELPRIPAEEVVGTVHEVGVGVYGVRTGQRVYVYPGQWCGECAPCRGGAENLCHRMSIMGFHRDGGFAEYVCAPARSLIQVPEGLLAEHAVFAEPLSCCLNALERASLQDGERIGIWGAGPAGRLLQKAAHARGAEPVVFDPDPRRQALAVRSAATAYRDGEHLAPKLQGASDGHDKSMTVRRFDVCIVAVGSAEAYHEAFSRLAPRGRLVVFSGLLPHDDPQPISLNTLHYQEQTVVGAYGCAYRHGQQALGLLASGATSVAELISDRLPLAALAEGLEIVAQRRGMKVLLYPDGTAPGRSLRR